jgi:hypothetical protein
LLSSRLIMSFLWSYHNLPDIHRDICAEEKCQISRSSLILCKSRILCTTVRVNLQGTGLVWRNALDRQSGRSENHDIVHPLKPSRTHWSKDLTNRRAGYRFVRPWRYRWITSLCLQTHPFSLSNLENLDSHAIAEYMAIMFDPQELVMKRFSHRKWMEWWESILSCVQNPCNPLWKSAEVTLSVFHWWSVDGITLKSDWNLVGWQTLPPRKAWDVHPPESNGSRVFECNGRPRFRWRPRDSSRWTFVESCDIKDIDLYLMNSRRWLHSLAVLLLGFHDKGISHHQRSFRGGVFNPRECGLNKLFTWVSTNCFEVSLYLSSLIVCDVISEDLNRLKVYYSPLTEIQMSSLLFHPSPSPSLFPCVQAWFLKSIKISPDEHNAWRLSEDEVRCRILPVWPSGGSKCSICDRWMT